jgi:primosomal protein N'
VGDECEGDIVWQIYSLEINLESTLRWQKEWKNCTKAAITKQYFTTVEDILKTKMIVAQNIAAMLTGRGKTRAYLHRF